MKLKSILLIFSMVFVYTFSIAQHGGLDNTFGNDGIVTTAIGENSDLCQDIAVQNDGKILLVGSTNNGVHMDLALVRYKTDGTLDNSFSDDGITTINLGGDVRGTCVVEMPDGKILAGGSQGDQSNRDFIMFKFNSDGSLDMTFGTNGRVVTDFGSSNDIASNILLTPEGKILMTGTVFGSVNKGFSAARYHSDGILDISFDGDGKVSFEIGSEDFCASSVLQPDGKIILFGETFLSENVDFAAIRCNEDGTLDSNFGVNGKVVTDLGTDNDVGFSLALQEDNKILATGQTDVGLQRKLAVVRYLEDGSLDNTFGVGGIASLFLGELIYGNSVSIQKDGKVLVAGTTISPSSGDEEISLVRLNTEGSFDNTFGTNGIVNTDIGGESSSDFSKCIALQSDSKILVGGTAFFPGTNSEFTLARYLSGFGLGVNDFSILDDVLLVYPNPIVESTVIEYTLTNAETISIDLYDISGRLVQSIVRSDKRAKGPHKEILVLDTSIPSGTYMLTLSNGVGSSSVQLVK